MRDLDSVWDDPEFQKISKALADDEHKHRFASSLPAEGSKNSFQKESPTMLKVCASSSVASRNTKSLRFTQRVERFFHAPTS